MQSSLLTLHHQFFQDIEKVQTTAALEGVKIKYLGKKGPVQQLMKELKEVAAENRPEEGKKINDLKELFIQKCEQVSLELIQLEEASQLAAEALDITFPGRQRLSGRKHPLNQARDQIIEILIGMGFSVQYGPDIDTDYYNFEVLNFPPEHPVQDTFYITPHVLLRTHTSNIQARVMELNSPPIRIIAPGKVYRNEAITARSHVFFQQIEALYIDRGVAFTDLMATLDEFLNKLFAKKIQTRYRPSYFPFVEPGMEVDISCLACQGKGCGLCKLTGWVEIAGAGMVHPEVLKKGGIDSEIYTGFAWGLGLERLVMMLKGIQDIRLFTENDLRFLRQFTSL